MTLAFWLTQHNPLELSDTNSSLDMRNMDLSTLSLSEIQALVPTLQQQHEQISQSIEDHSLTNYRLHIENHHVGRNVSNQVLL